MKNDNEREVTNPHDKIYIDYTDKEAAQVAVLAIGHGRYGIMGDGGMPVFLLGGLDKWVEKTYNTDLENFVKSVSHERIIKALRSIRIEGKRSSVNDLVGRAHDYADAMERKLKDGDHA